MSIQFDLRKSTNENASLLFEKSKKLRSKIQGITETITSYEKKRTLAENKELEKQEQYSQELERKQRKKAWFEKFHWFYTSKNHLCIGGRDAATNEQIIKKYTEKEDLVFHTDMAGSPFFVLKKEQSTKEFSEEEFFEVASLTACYSKAWKKGLSSTDVFYVNPDQVTKDANAGESLAKGSFMIRGKTNYASHEMKLAISIDSEERVVIGISRIFATQEKPYAVITQGSNKASDTAKKLQKFFKKGLLDEFVKVIPPGGNKSSLILGSKK